MKILHFILGKANPDRANGVNHVIYGLCKYSSLAGHDVLVIGLSKGMKDKYELVQRDQFQVEVYNKFFGRCFNELKHKAKDADVVHLHSVWQHYNIIFANYLISINKPYIVTIHSGLTDDRLRQSNYRFKLLYHSLFQKRIFDAASGIHAITREEITSISKFTKNDNIFFIPNGIDTTKFSLNAKTYNQKSKEISFGYLGRFGIEKNIRNLIISISQLPSEYLAKIKCFLIGPLDKEAKKFQILVKKLNLTKNIIFTGPIYGKKKYEILNNLDFYVHPANSDVVSIAVMEAMASGLPCIITRTSQVAYYYKSDSFIMVEPVVIDLKRGISEMLKYQNKWPLMSQNSIELVSYFFNWKSIVELFINEYNQILNSSRLEMK